MNGSVGSRKRGALALLLALLATVGFVGAAPQAGAQAQSCNIGDFVVDGVVNTTGYLICQGTLTVTQAQPAADCPTADDKVSAIADPYTVAPGGNTTFSAFGFAPNGQVQIFICSTPISLGTFTADAQGNVILPVTVPAGTTLGAHTLAATGTSPSGRSRVAYAAINVVASSTTATTATGALPTTGSDSGRLVAIGGALILLGGAALAGSIKSRRTSTATA